MQIKAQALIHAAAWLEETHGRDAVSTVLARCSRAVNERYVSAISMEWHPIEEFLELLDVTEAVVGCGDRRTARDSGAYSARLLTRSLVKRALFYLARPEFLVRRAASFWRQFNDAGELHLREFHKRKIVMELTDMPLTHPLLCESITGWVGVVAEGVGATDCAPQHPFCRAAGYDRCLYVVHWDARREIDEAVARRA